MTVPSGGVARSVLAGPIGAVVNSVLGAPARPSASAIVEGPVKIAAQISQAFGPLFEQNRAETPGKCPPRPVPFLAPATILPQMEAMDAKITEVAGKLAPVLDAACSSQGSQPLKAAQQLLSSLTNLQPFVGPVAGSFETIAAIGARIDRMLKESEQLVLSEKKEDQLKGLRMLQDSLGMCNTISQVIKAQARMQRSLISDSARRGLRSPKPKLKTNRKNWIRPQDWIR